VQELMKSKSGKSNKTFTGAYPLTGILRCPVCNSGMVAGRVVSTRKDGTKNITRYYYCGAWRNKGTAVCRSNGVRADDVEMYVFQKLKRLVTSDAFLKATLSKVNNKRRNMLLPAEDNVKNIEKEILELTKHREQYFKLMEKRAIDENTLLEKLQDISDKIAKLENDKGTQKKYMSVSEVKEVPYDLVKVTLGEFGELLKMATSNEEKKTLLHLLIEEIKLSNHRRPENITIKFNRVLVDYITENGGLPKEGSPLLRSDRILGLSYYDFQITI
jgi:site-specific DNA recombinase